MTFEGWLRGRPQQGKSWATWNAMHPAQGRPQSGGTTAYVQPHPVVAKPVVGFRMKPAKPFIPHALNTAVARSAQKPKKPGPLFGDRLLAVGPHHMLKPHKPLKPKKPKKLRRRIRRNSIIAKNPVVVKKPIAKKPILTKVPSTPVVIKKPVVSKPAIVKKMSHHAARSVQTRALRRSKKSRERELCQNNL